MDQINSALNEMKTAVANKLTYAAKLPPKALRAVVKLAQALDDVELYVRKAEEASKPKETK